MRLSDFAALSFDCYGTLVDWETGISDALVPLLTRSQRPYTRDEVLHTFARHEAAQEAATPSMRYAALLAAVHARIAREWQIETTEGEDQRFGASIPFWPLFDDTVAALRYLKEHYRLFVLSNVDRTSFNATNARLGIEFDGVFTAEAIGSYKPDRRNFTYLIERLAERGIPKHAILHTAESLFHDHLPANEVGLASAHIHRRHAQGGFGATHPPDRMPHLDFTFTSLANMVHAHAQEQHSHAP